MFKTQRRRGAAAVVALGLATAPLLAATAEPALAVPCANCDPGGGGTGGDTTPPPPAGLPALVAEANDYVGQGVHMDTVARVSRNVGLVSGEPTHTWTTWWGVGGHGSVAVELLNANGDVLAVTDPHTYGVDAKSIFWNRSSRFDTWYQSFEPVVTENTTGIKILHTSATRDNFLTDLRQVRDKACTTWAVIRPGQSCPLGPVN